MTDRLQRYFVIYEAAHRTRMCRISHVIGIPLILFTTYAALDWIPLFEVPGTGGFTFSFGHLWYLGMLVWYSRLSLGLTALMAAIGATMLFWAFGLMVGGLFISLVLPVMMLRQVQVATT